MVVRSRSASTKRRRPLKGRARKAVVNSRPRDANGRFVAVEKRHTISGPLRRGRAARSRSRSTRDSRLSSSSQSSRRSRSQSVAALPIAETLGAPKNRFVASRIQRPKFISFRFVAFQLTSLIKI
ncbi:hypothetical protein Tcan_02795 [Toxocara canis]|uniref:Uncharacterized protein n=1 Tax=Toxocara canis TaxID=6265 RepID=A0A0B2VBL3_TOXCA|nr:hypothetical protein Tcan_02795 [Toxocara canis]